MLVENHSSVGLTTYLLIVVFFLLIPGLRPYKLFLLKSLLIETFQGQLNLAYVPIDMQSLWSEERNALFDMAWITRLWNKEMWSPSPPM